MSKRALLVVDVQNDYFPGGKWTLSGMDAASDNVARLVAAAREAGDPVIHVQHVSVRPGAPFFVPGSEGVEIHKKVAPKPGEAVIVKNQINSFRDTNLKTVLDGHGVKDLIVCGAMSHMCIDAATRAAADFGYTVTVVHDACATRDLDFNGVTVAARDVHAAFMAALAFAYAKVVSTEDVFTSILQAA